MYRILLAGCGQLGSRHLQAVASLANIKEVYIVDPDHSALAAGKASLKEVNGLNTAIEFKWRRDYDRIPAWGDLCIIATQAKGRSELLKMLAGQLRYKNFLIEKLVSRSVDEYRSLVEFCQEKELSVWVNCKTRAYAIHKYIKKKLDPDEPISFSELGGNYGLVNNGIHSADLFIFYDQTKQIRFAGSRIDPVLHASKRGSGIFDLSGALYGFSEKGSDFIISLSLRHDSPGYISIASTHCRFIVDHFQKIAYESYAESGWLWKSKVLNEDWTVSHMSKAFVNDILLNGACELPSIYDCQPAHEFILGGLLPHFNRLLKADNNYCPVT